MLYVTRRCCGKFIDKFIRRKGGGGGGGAKEDCKRSEFFDTVVVWHLLYTRSYEKRKGRLRLAEATVAAAAAQPREIMALVTAVHL